MPTQPYAKSIVKNTNRVTWRCQPEQRQPFLHTPRHKGWTDFLYLCHVLLHIRRVLPLFANLPGPPVLFSVLFCQAPPPHQVFFLFLFFFSLPRLGSRRFCKFLEENDFFLLAYYRSFILLRPSDDLVVDTRGGLWGRMREIALPYRKGSILKETSNSLRGWYRGFLFLGKFEITMERFHFVYMLGRYFLLPLKCTCFKISYFITSVF